MLFQILVILLWLSALTAQRERSFSVKYLLYRFPRVLEWTQDEEDLVLPESVTFPVQPELVAVEYGNSIHEVVDDLMRAIVDELSCTEEYKSYQFTAILEESTEILSLYTDRKFNYRMQGIVMPIYGKENLLVDFGVVEVKQS